MILDAAALQPIYLMIEKNQATFDSMRLRLDKLIRKNADSTELAAFRDEIVKCDDLSDNQKLFFWQRMREFVKAEGQVIQSRGQASSPVTDPVALCKSTRDFAIALSLLFNKVQETKQQQLLDKQQVVSLAHVANLCHDLSQSQKKHIFKQFFELSQQWSQTDRSAYTVPDFLAQKVIASNPDACDYKQVADHVSILYTAST